jgi:hypothetical protein
LLIRWVRWIVCSIVIDRSKKLKKRLSSWRRDDTLIAVPISVAIAIAVPVAVPVAISVAVPVAVPVAISVAISVAVADDGLTACRRSEQHERAYSRDAENDW